MLRADIQQLYQDAAQANADIKQSYTASSGSNTVYIKLG